MTDDRLASIATLRKLVRYNPDTGKLFWNEREESDFPPVKRGSSPFLTGTWNRRHAGKEAFCQTNKKGYKVGKLLGRYAAAHRVAWAMAYGRWPINQIDHINGDRSDNRLRNLREVTLVENSRNTKRPSTNTSGHIGVGYHKNVGKWFAHISVSRKMRHLGYFADKADAIAARLTAERELGFHPNHGRS